MSDAEAELDEQDINPETMRRFGSPHTSDEEEYVPPPESSSDEEDEDEDTADQGTDQGKDQGDKHVDDDKAGAGTKRKLVVRAGKRAGKRKKLPRSVMKNITGVLSAGRGITRRKNRCGFCRELGHDRRNCPKIKNEQMRAALKLAGENLNMTPVNEAKLIASSTASLTRSASSASSSSAWSSASSSSPSVFELFSEKHKLRDVSITAGALGVGVAGFFSVLTCVLSLLLALQ